MAVFYCQVSFWFHTRKKRNVCFLYFMHHCSDYRKGGGGVDNVKEFSIYAGNAATRPRKVWLMCDLSLDFLP